MYISEFRVRVSIIPEVVDTLEASEQMRIQRNLYKAYDTLLKGRPR